MTVNNLEFKKDSSDSRLSGGIKDASRDELKALLEQNKEMLEAILKNSKKMNRFIISQQVFGVIKILIFVIPIILGIIYLPALLQELMAPYQELMGLTETAGGLNSQLDSIDPSILNKFLK